jgi:hypothetical protein
MVEGRILLKPECLGVHIKEAFDTREPWGTNDCELR